MPTLHLGVMVLPYSVAPSPKAKKPAPGTQSTGDVAGWIEDKYHVMAHFFELHGQDIATAMENSLAGALNNLLMNAPSGAPMAGAESEIEAIFRHMLASRELEALGYPGIPTQAAIKGVNHRLKSGRGPRRPSFIDTAQYQSSFKSWFD